MPSSSGFTDRFDRSIYKHEGVLFVTYVLDFYLL